MVRQGGYKLRFHGQLQLVVATFLTLALTISMAGPLYAETAETEKTIPRGFSRTSSYYSDVKTLKYYTATEVKKVKFIVYETDSSEDSVEKEISTLTEESTPSVDHEEYKMWQVSDIPTTGTILGVQVQEAGSSWKEVEADTVAIALEPTLVLTPYSGRKGGSTMSVNGKVEGKVLEGAKFTARLLTSEGQERSSTSATRSGENISASLPLPEGLEGEYIVELSLTHGDLEIAAEKEAVSLMTHKPTVQMRLSQDPPYANEAFELYATSSTKAPLAGMTLTYADQTVEMTPQGGGSYVHSFPLGLSSDTYEFKIVARDALGNSNQSAPAVLQKFLVLRVVTSPKNDKGLLPVVPLKPVSVLSTEFEPLLIPKTRVSDPKDKRDEADRAFVLGAETEKLKEVVNLNEAKEEVDAPIDTSSAGWKMLGVPWYLWLTGSATAWGGIFAARWWFRRG